MEDNALQNALLCGLPDGLRRTLLQTGRQVLLRKGTVLYDEGERPARIHFITSGLASIVIETPQGNQVEVGMIGSEGAIGAGFLLGPLHSLSHCVIQVEATAWALPFQTVAGLFEADRPFQTRVLAFVQAYLFGVQQIAGCNRVHHAPERLVRWLLLSHLLAKTSTLHYTHDLLARMLAVQRTTISAILNELQDKRLLTHGWGTITLLDLLGLQRHTCACFSAVRSIYTDLSSARETL